MADWKTLENDLTNYLLSGKNDKTRTIEITAYKIASKYVTFIKNNASDMFGNRILYLNTILFSIGIEKCLKSSLKLKNNSYLSDMNKYLIQMWKLAKLENLKIPPGMTSIINNSVIYPGMSYSLVLNDNTNSKCVLATSIVNLFEKHFNTITGKLDCIPSPPATGIVPIIWNKLLLK